MSVSGCSPICYIQFSLITIPITIPIITVIYKPYISQYYYSIYNIIYYIIPFICYIPFTDYIIPLHYIIIDYIIYYIIYYPNYYPNSIPIYPITIVYPIIIMGYLLSHYYPNSSKYYIPI